MLPQSSSKFLKGDLPQRTSEALNELRVLTVQGFGEAEEAAAMANDTVYGLAAAIYKKDIDLALRLSSEVQAGNVMINKYYAGGVGSPFGGYKHSGTGREKGLAALDNYTQIKNVTVRVRR